MSLHGAEKEGFLDHLEILRRKMLVSALVVLLVTSVSLLYAGSLVDFLRLPLRQLEVSLIYIKPQEKLLTYLRAALFSGILVGIPFLMAEIVSFVLPGLTRGEKRWFLPTSIALILLFLAGAAGGFFILSPFALDFLVSFSTEGSLLPLWSIGGYLQFVISLSLVCGFLALLPLLLFFLFASGLVPVESVARARKYVILGIFLAAAFLTPPDIFTQISVGLLLYLFFELSLLAGRLVRRKKGERDG